MRLCLARWVYRHTWKEGDCVMWDNRAMIHRATPFPRGSGQRLMWRCTVKGGVPGTAWHRPPEPEPEPERLSKL